MKLVEVSPLTHSVAKDTLTYFSSKDVAPGDIVSVEVRKKIFDALVLNVRPVKDLKADLKNSTFGFKKVLKVSEALPIYREFFKAAIETKDFFIGNLGAIISALLPAAFLSAAGHIKTPPKRISIKKENQIFSFQAAYSDRLKFYKDYFRESFENGESVSICFPTINGAKNFYKLLKSDFNNCFLFYGSLPPKKFIENYNACLKSKEPILIVTTPTGLFVPRHDLRTLIIESESASGYRTIKRPYFSIPVFAKFLAKALKLNLIFADTILSTETIYETKEKNYEPLLPLQFKIDYAPKILTADMKNKEEKGKSYILSTNALKLIEKSLEKKAKIFLFTLRKGLASQIICHDCKTPLKDGGEPLVLFQNKLTGERILKNAITHAELETKLRCENCESWNFDTLGIGTDTVYEEVRNKFPKAKIFQIDKEVTKTPSQAKKVIKEFNETSGGILVGTEMAIPYLDQNIQNTILVSLDSMLNIPSFKVHERILHLLLSLAANTQKNFLIQSRDIKNPAIQAVTEKDLEKLFVYDLEKRKEFKYPPFATIIKITHLTSVEKAPSEKIFFQKLLASWSPLIHQGKFKKFVRTTAILKLPRADWDEGSLQTPKNIDKPLLETLSYLGPDFEIRINPERLF